MSGDNAAEALGQAGDAFPVASGTNAIIYACLACTAKLQNVLTFARMKWILIAAAAIVGYQTLCPPIVGLADQGDFRRVIGKFGYGPAKPATFYTFLTLKYVRDPTYRWPEWEQISSEDLFVGTAVLVNTLISKDGTLDIRVIGLIHALAFLGALTWLLQSTQGLRGKYYVWIALLLITTDVARVVYFNTFYAEPASYIFCILLLSEGARLCVEGVSPAWLARWSLWTVLFVLAKTMNAPLGLLLAAYTIRLTWGSNLMKPAWIGATAIVLTCVFCIVTAPPPMRDVNAYEMVFLAVLPESKAPSADAAALGIDPALTVLSGVGAWETTSAYPQLRARKVIGANITVFTVLRFYLMRPARTWRRIRRQLPVAIRVRPPLGSLDRSSGSPPGSTSSAFSLLTDFHERLLVAAARLLFLLLPIPAVVALIRRIHTGEMRLAEECFGLLGLCCMTSFLAITFSSPWETIKHMLVFNFLIDAWLLCVVTFALTAMRKKLTALEARSERWSRRRTVVRRKYEYV